MKEIKVAEFFAGVGGFRIGLERASSVFNTVFASQWEPNKKNQFAYDCYARHYGLENHSNEDIATVNKKDIPDIDLLVGGYPCQDFSVANSGAKGIEGKKGVLWWQIRDTLEVKRPKFGLFENVDRLLKSPSKQRGRDFGIILASLYDLGYNVEWRVINAGDYGFPQRRRRVFIFAYLRDEFILDKDYTFFNDIFESEDNAKKSKLESTFNLEYSNLVDVSDNFEFQFCNWGTMENGVIHTKEVVSTYNSTQTTLRDVLESDVDEKYYLGEDLDKWRYLKGAKKIPRKVGTPHEYVFSEGALAFPDHLDKPSRTMLTSESSKNRSTHVVLDPQTDRLRTLTPIECERLNGFSDNWTEGMSDRQRYFCMGNALVVDLIEIMGKEIARLNENMD